MLNRTMAKYSIITLGEVHSTNSYALDKFSFFADKTVVFTKKQTCGRGRYNRKWCGDDSENLYLSIVLKPEEIASYPFSNLTQYLSVVLCKYLENEFSLKPSIKWPNDILVDGCKISGILAEASNEKNKIQGIVLGLGLNVNLKAETLENIDQKATSISILKNNNYDVENILKGLCDLFFDSYNEFIKNGFGFIKKDYIDRCNFLGKEITVKGVTETKKYLAISIDDNGLLVVKDDLGKESKIITGDVLC